MFCKALLALMIVVLGHKSMNQAMNWFSPPTVTSETDNVVIKIEPEEFLRSGPVRGSVVVHGTSAFADETMFKTHLVELMKRQEKSLHQLQVHHIEVFQPMTLPAPMSQPQFVPNAHGAWVPHQNTFDFTTGFDHSRGISRRAVQDALRHIAMNKRVWVEPKPVRGSFARYLQTSGSLNSALHHDLEPACEAECSDYMFHSCNDCKGNILTIKPTCTCYMSKMEFYGEVLGTPIWGILMCITGAILAGSIKQQPRVTSLSGDFDGVCNCFQDMPSCCLGFFCPAVRAAQNYHVASINEFFPMLFLMATLYGVPSVGYILAFFAVCICRTSKIRPMMSTPADACMDCCCSFFCTECVICQEARLIDNSSKGGGGGIGAVVGQPVGA